MIWSKRVGMAVRPRPVGSDPIERVSHPMDLLQIGSVYIGSVRIPIMKYLLDIGSHWVQNQFTISSPPLRLKATSSTGTPATAVILLFSWSGRSLFSLEPQFPVQGTPFLQFLLYKIFDPLFSWWRLWISDLLGFALDLYVGFLFKIIESWRFRGSKLGHVI